MPESFEDLLTGIAESGARAAGESGAAAARSRGHQRTVRRRSAAGAFALVLLAGAAGIAAASTPHGGHTPPPLTHTTTPGPVPTNGPSTSASPSPSAGSSDSSSPSTTQTTATGDLNTVVPAAWVPLSAFPDDDTVKWTAQSTQPAIHTADRQWFSSCLDGRLSTTGALGYQELTATSGKSGDTDAADQVLFFYPSTAAAQSALATIAHGYANCPKATAGVDDKPITDSLTQTEHIDGAYAWQHTYIGANQNPDAPADRAAFNHEYFVQRGDAVEMVWLGGVSGDFMPVNPDLQFLAAMAGSLCTYGGECEPAGQPLTTTISAVGGTSLTPEGPAVQFVEFTVGLTNNLASTVSGIAPVVSLSHCTCVTGPVPVMPAGTLELWDAAAGTWKSVVYDREGSGMDFIISTPVPAFDLAAGQSVSFKFRMALSADQPVSVHNGSGRVNVTIIHPANPGTEIGDMPAAQLPVTVTVG